MRIFIAKPRGDVEHRADSCIVEPALEADCAKRGEAVRYADAEVDGAHRCHVSVKAALRPSL